MIDRLRLNSKAGQTAKNMKRLFIIMFIAGILATLILPSVSATFSFSNYAEHTPIDGSKYGKIDVFDGNLILPDEKIKTFTLLENTEQCGRKCYAVISLTMYKEGSLFDAINFYYGNVESSSIYFVERVEYEQEVIDFERVCSIVKVTNNITNETEEIEKCNRVAVGSHIENLVRYDEKERYEMGDVKAGEYIIKIKGEKGIADNVDWVISTDGIEGGLSEWAWWVGVQPLAYYEYENSLADSSGNGFTLQGGSSVVYNATEFKLGSYSRSFKGLANDINNVDYNGSVNALGTGDFTVLFWIHTTSSLGANTQIISDTGRFAGTTYHWEFHASTTNLFIGKGGGTNILDMGAKTQINDGNWHRVVLRRNSTDDVEGFIDGVSKGSASFTDDLHFASLYLGGNINNEANNLVGELDEVAVFNYSFTDADIAYDYNAGAGRSLGSAPPVSGLTVTLSYPKEGYNTTSTTVGIGCNFTGTGVTNITSVNVTVWNSTGNIVFGNDTTVTATQSYNITWTTGTLSDGKYNWTCAGFGNDANGTTSNRTFIIDNVAPTITLDSPSSGIYSGSNASINYTASDSSSGLGSCWYTLNGGVTNTSLASCANSTALLNPGNNTLTVYANDTAGNIGNSTTVYPYYFPLLSYCNATSKTRYLNYSFKDEATDANINSTIALTGYYWIDDVDNFRVLTYTNTSLTNPSYPFCSYDNVTTFQTNFSINYYFTNYPLRNYIETGNLTNVTTNRTLYLLGSTDGIYTSILVTDSVGNLPSDVHVVVTRDIGGTTTTVGDAYADASGLTTFFLNFNYLHTFTVTATGCTSKTTSFVPVQAAYTIKLDCATSTTTSQSQIDGVYYRRGPESGVTAPGAYEFWYMVESAYRGITAARFSLTNATATITNSTFTHCNASACYQTLSYTVKLGENIKGKYYVTINGTEYMLEGDAYWRAINTTAGTYSLWYVLGDFANMFDEWGTDDNNCGAHLTAGTCNADANCKWWLQSNVTYTAVYRCIPVDRANRIEFSRIVFLFLCFAILFAIGNRLSGGMDAINPGLMMIFLTVFIWVGSIAGLFNYNGLTPFSLVNNYILALSATLFMVGYACSLARKNT